MKKLFLIVIFGIFLIGLGSATSSFYDPTSDVTAVWDEGTGLTFAEIDEGIRQPTANATITVDNVADSTQGPDGVSEFNFDTVTETPNNITLWVYTETGSSCNYNFLLQQAGATRCSQSITSATAAGWQSCTWATPTGDYSTMTIELSQVTKGGGGHTVCTVHEAYLEVDYTVNNAPNMSNVTADFVTIQGGDTITFYANTTSNGVNDTDVDSLTLYCDTTNTPTAENTECTGGTTTDATYPYALSCAFATAQTDQTNLEYCRVYDGIDYSPVSNFTYTTDSTAPTLTVDSVAGDSVASYYDTANNGATMINISGESNMACRWSSSDLSYSSMSNACVIDGTVASCNVTDVATEDLTTRYLACQDNLTNEHNATNNLDVSFFLDYTAPTTSDNSVVGVQAPNYTVTLTEFDNVDADPTTLYCTDILGVCIPSISIDNLGTIIFTSLNRGINYLRYNSTDDAGNIQTMQNKTININQLPVLTSATDNATTIGGGEFVNITSVSSDSDSQDLTLWVCDSTSVTSSGCGGTEYCNATGSDNVTCLFTAESDSAAHTWYAFLYDTLGEMSVANATGTYTTDSTSPIITLVSPTNASTITQSSVTFTVSVDEALSTAWYSLDGGTTNVTMTNTTLLSYTHTNTSIADGTYNMIFWANDSYGNLGILEGNSFTIDTAVSDTTAPTITVQSPSNNSYDIDESVLLNITMDENITWAGYTNNSGTLTNLGNTSMTSWNATVIFVEGQHDIIFYANDSSSNQGNESVIVYVDLNNAAVSNFSCTDVNDSVDVVCTIEASDSIGLSSFKVGQNSTGTWVNSSLVSFTGTSNSTTYTLGSGNHSPLGFSAQLYVYDLSGRVNDTETESIIISDDTTPVINNFTYIPNVTSDLDPNVTINVNATITEDYNISSVNLMYWNTSSSSWTFVTMNNNSALTVGAESTVVYNASFTPENGTWIFRINATDFAGNAITSANTTVVVENDTSEDITTTISDVESVTYAQRTNNNSLGFLTMNNTGDGTIGFNVSLTSSSANIQNRLSVNYTDAQTQNYTAASGADVNITIDVNTTGLTTGLYDYNITILSDVGTTVLEKQLNIQTAVGPYLVTSIDTYSSSVTRGQTGIELVASVTNLGTSDATGTYLNWTLPSGFSLASGSLTRNLGAIAIGVSGTNTITIDVSNSITDSLVNISASASASGVNASSAMKNISISDPLTITITTTPSSGGGGGSSVGGGAGGGSKVYHKIIDVVRGEETYFEIELTNPYPNSTLKDLEVELTGFLSQYISYEKYIPKSLQPGESFNLRVNLSAPSYKSYEEHDLLVKIIGNLDKGIRDFPYQEIQNIKLIVQEVSKKQAEDKLSEAARVILEMQKRGLYTEKLSELLQNANYSLINEVIYKKSYDFSEEILSVKEDVDEAEDLLKRILISLGNPKESGLLVGKVISKNYEDISVQDLLTLDSFFATSEIIDLLELSVIAFERGGYETAFERAKEARTLLVLERKGNFLFFLYLNWQYLVIGVITLLFLGTLFRRLYRKKSIGRRIIDINKEEQKMHQNSIENQRAYFKGKKDVSNYKATDRNNQSKIVKLKKERINLRNKRIKLLSPREIHNELDNERREIEDEVRKIQKEYYKTRKISEKEYDLQFEGLNERLAEIEDESATIELMNSHKKVNPKKTTKEHKKMENHEVKKSIRKTLGVKKK